MAYALDKWTKYKFLIKSKSLTKALPLTKKMNRKNFWSMLEQFQKAIVKPSTGSGGRGVLRISKSRNGRYHVHSGSTKHTFRGKKATYHFIHRKIKGSSHIIQQYIPLARIDKRPFDIRAMVQRSKNSKWKLTGSLAKIAGSGYFITNVARSKGKVVTVPTAIQSSNIHILQKKEKKIQNKIKKLSLKTAEKLQKYYPFLHTIGLDVGLDKEGRVWIIEANFSPNKELFLRLKDKSIYKQIIKYSPKTKKKSKRK